MFEPLPSEGLIKMMKNLSEKGGNVIWCGPPPLLDSSGKNCTSEWKELFGVDHAFNTYMGEIGAGRKIDFLNRFIDVPQQTILTDFLVDRIYPVTLNKNCEILASSDGKLLGTCLQSERGKAYYFGFRPRDDQSASLGYESRTLFEILNTCGEYQATGKFEGVNDNPTFISRTTDCLATTFPNGSNMVVKHYRTHAENWEGGFSRNQEEDEKALALNPLPSDTLVLDDFKVNGHQVSFRGKQSLVFRTDSLNKLIAFEGHNCKEVKIDGISYEFSRNPFKSIIFSKEEDKGAGYFAVLSGDGTIMLPIVVSPGEKMKITTTDNKRVKFQVTDGHVEIVVIPQISGKKIRIEVK
jgi:hypothetical protein